MEYNSETRSEVPALWRDLRRQTCGIWPSVLLGRKESAAAEVKTVIQL